MVNEITKIIKINPHQPEPQKIKAAAAILQADGLVAFPTETVYGLGANALSEAAVTKLFQAKRRPAKTPLIVGVADEEAVADLVADLPESAQALMAKFWPGPLTLIMHKSQVLPPITCGGLNSVAIRMPAHPVARELITQSGLPITIPSANLSGKPSPTSAQEVMEDLGGRIDLVLDAGLSPLGIESTIIDLTHKSPEILRVGGITPEEIKEVISELKISPTLLCAEKYGLGADLILVEGSPEAILKKLGQLYHHYTNAGKKVGLLVTEESAAHFGHKDFILGKRRDFNVIASNLYKTLRKISSSDLDIVLIEGIDSEGLGLAIMDRLRKAANRRIIVR